MGDWLVWLLLGSFIVILFCIYSLSSQVERCVRLAVEIITGNQRRILEQLDTLRSAQSAPHSPNVLAFERRVAQRRQAPSAPGESGDRRRSPGRRKTDMEDAQRRF